MNRISTAGQHSAAIAQIIKQQIGLARTQAQVASGNRLQTPSDDPVASVSILSMERTRSQIAQYGRNAGIAEDRLSLGEQSLADLQTLLQRVQELTVQANNGALDDVSLKSIATELRSRAEELLQVANRQDSNGEYLFAGYSTGTQPFAKGGASVLYLGDQGVRQLQISSSQKMADGFSGDRVFMTITEGNGTFVAEEGGNTVTPGPNTGTGIIGVGQLVDAGAWQAAAADFAAMLPPLPQQYQIRFIDQTLPADGVAESWELLDVNGDPVMDGGAPPAPITGTYVDGGAISFHGIQIAITGQPAVGDTFAVRPAGKESLFKTLDDLVGALEAGSATPARRASLGSAVNKALTQLDLGLNHIIDLRTEIGARLNALDTAASLREDLDYQLTGSISELKDVDFAEAISRLNMQMVGLQAAQQAYTRIGQLSLFDYMR